MVDGHGGVVVCVKSEIPCDKKHEIINLEYAWLDFFQIYDPIE